MMKALGVVVGAALFVGLPVRAEDATDVSARDMLQRSDDAGSFDVGVNAGVGGFLGQLSDFTGVGPVWGVNLDGKVTRGLGWELAYNGSRTPITDERVAPSAALWRNGVNALAKVYAPVDMNLKPFAGVGLGGSYVNVNDDAESLYRNDFIAELPVAAGVEYSTGHGISAGARAMYRFMAGEEFAKTATAGESPEGGLLSAQITLGGAF